MKKIAFLLTTLMLLALTACANPYEVTEGNDAVSAAEAIPFEEKKSGCTADSYSMNIALDVEKNTVSGNTVISLTNQSGGVLDEICLRFLSPAMTSKSKIEYIRNAENGQDYGFDTSVEKTLIRIPLEGGALKNGEGLKLDVGFVSYIPKTNNRFGYYKDGANRLYNMCHCFPQLAFLDDGAWDENPYLENGECTYNEASDYFINLTVPDGYVIAASGVSETEGGNTRIEAPGVREIAITACNFAEVETREVNGVRYRMLKPAFDIKNQALLEDIYDVMLEIAIDSLGFFENMLGEYIYDELDIVPIFIKGSGEGMEMPGLVYIDIESIPKAKIDGKFFTLPAAVDTIISTVAHEVGHEFFCYAVGNDQGGETWLDESFTTYVQNYYLRKSDFANDLYNKVLEKYQESMSTVYSINTSVDSSETCYINLPAYEYTKKDYGLVYSLGDRFLRELEETMGEERFLEMLSDWYTQNTNKIVEGYAFIQHVSKYDSSEGVKNVLNTYLSENHLR